MCNYRGQRDDAVDFLGVQMTPEAVAIIIAAILSGVTALIVSMFKAGGKIIGEMRAVGLNEKQQRQVIELARQTSAYKEDRALLFEQVKRTETLAQRTQADIQTTQKEMQQLAATMNQLASSQIEQGRRLRSIEEKQERILTQTSPGLQRPEEER